MMKRLTLSALCAATVVLPLLSTVSQASAGEVRNREVRQERRIEQGVNNGTIQPGEYRNLQRRETAINDTRLHDLQQNKGRLTPQERQQLNWRENQLSRSIYRDKHNPNDFNRTPVDSQFRTDLH